MLKRLWRRIQKAMWGKRFLCDAQRYRKVRQEARAFFGPLEAALNGLQNALDTRYRGLENLRRAFEETPPLRPAQELVTELQRAHRAQNENSPPW